MRKRSKVHKFCRPAIDEEDIAVLAKERSYRDGGKGPDYFFPPHGGRPPSDEAVREATARYMQGKKRTSK